MAGATKEPFPYAFALHNILTLEECEYLIEEVFGKDRIENKRFKMIKGNVKKWQILDDEAHDRD